MMEYAAFGSDQHEAVHTSLSNGCSAVVIVIWSQ